MSNSLKSAFPPAGILPNYEATLSIAEKSSWILVPSNPDIKGNLPFIQEVGLFFTHSDYYTQRADLPSFLFLYTLQGEGELYLNSLDHPKYKLTPGTMCWIDCTHLHKYSCSRTMGHWDFIWIHAHGGFLSAYFSEYMRINKSCLINTYSDNIFTIMQSILSFSTKNTGLLLDAYQSANLLNGLATAIITTAINNKQPSATNHYIQKAIEYMNQHFSEDISLNQVADHIFLSKCYFHRLFTQTINCTPHNYLNTIRLQHAKELLRNTVFPVQDIATKVGFGNYSYFIQLFKHREGITPSAYRRQWNNV